MASLSIKKERLINVVQCCTEAKEGKISVVGLEIRPSLVSLLRFSAEELGKITLQWAIKTNGDHVRNPGIPKTFQPSITVKGMEDIG